MTGRGILSDKEIVLIDLPHLLLIGFGEESLVLQYLEEVQDLLEAGVLDLPVSCIKRGCTEPGLQGWRSDLTNCHVVLLDLIVEHSLLL